PTTRAASSTTAWPSAPASSSTASCCEGDAAVTDTDLSHWQPCPVPQHAPLAGRFVSLEPLDAARHAGELWTALHGPHADPQQWQYMAYGPFAARGAFDAWLAERAAGRDPLFFAVREHAGGRVLGQLAL